MRLGLRRTPVRLLDLDLRKSNSERDDCDEEDARRWRCIRVGSMSGTFANRANKERTMDLSVSVRKAKGMHELSTMDTIPERFPTVDWDMTGEADPESVVRNNRWAFAKGDLFVRHEYLVEELFLLARSFSIVYESQLDGETEYTGEDHRNSSNFNIMSVPGYLSAPSVDPSGSCRLVKPWYVEIDGLASYIDI